MTFKIWANCSFVNVKLLYSEILHIKEEENRIQGLVFALEKSEKDKFGGRLLYFGPPYWNLCLQITLTEVLFVLQKILTFSLRECAKSTWRNPSIFFQWPGQQIWNIQIRDLEEDHKGGILKIAHLSILTTRQGDLRSLVIACIPWPSLRCNSYCKGVCLPLGHWSNHELRFVSRRRKPLPISCLYLIYQIPLQNFVAGPFY